MQIANSMEKNDNDSSVVVKRLSVPLGLEELMESLTKQVLQKKPRDIYSFASDHFAKLLELRDKSSDKLQRDSSNHTTPPKTITLSDSQANILSYKSAIFATVPSRLRSSNKYAKEHEVYDKVGLDQKISSDTVQYSQMVYQRMVPTTLERPTKSLRRQDNQQQKQRQLQQGRKTRAPQTTGEGRREKRRDGQEQSFDEVSFQALVRRSSTERRKQYDKDLHNIRLKKTQTISSEESITKSDNSNSNHQKSPEIINNRKSRIRPPRGVTIRQTESFEVLDDNIYVDGNNIPLVRNGLSKRCENAKIIAGAAIVPALLLDQIQENEKFNNEDKQKSNIDNKHLSEEIMLDTLDDSVIEFADNSIEVAQETFDTLVTNAEELIDYKTDEIVEQHYKQVFTESTSIDLVDKTKESVDLSTQEVIKEDTLKDTNVSKKITTDAEQMFADFTINEPTFEVEDQNANKNGNIQGPLLSNNGTVDKTVTNKIELDIKDVPTTTEQTFKTNVTVVEKSEMIDDIPVALLTPDQIPPRSAKDESNVPLVTATVVNAAKIIIAGSLAGVDEEVAKILLEFNEMQATQNFLNKEVAYYKSEKSDYTYIPLRDYSLDKEDSLNENDTKDLTVSSEILEDGSKEVAVEIDTNTNGVKKIASQPTENEIIKNNEENSKQLVNSDKDNNTKSFVISTPKVDDTIETLATKDTFFGKEVSPRVVHEECLVSKSNRAATQIQSAWRGHRIRKRLARKRVQKMEDSDELPEYQLAAEDALRAATTIQAFLRGHLVRKALRQGNVSVIDSPEKCHILEEILEEPEVEIMAENQKILIEDKDTIKQFEAPTLIKRIFTVKNEKPFADSDGTEDIISSPNKIDVLNDVLPENTSSVNTKIKESLSASNVTSDSDNISLLPVDSPSIDKNTLHYEMAPTRPITSENTESATKLDSQMLRNSLEIVESATEERQEDLTQQIPDLVDTEIPDSKLDIFIQDNELMNMSYEEDVSTESQESLNTVIMVKETLDSVTPESDTSNTLDEIDDSIIDVKESFNDMLQHDNNVSPVTIDINEKLSRYHDLNIRHDVENSEFIEELSTVNVDSSELAENLKNTLEYENNNTIIIQTENSPGIPEEKNIKILTDIISAATKIQSLYRGYKVRAKTYTKPNGTANIGIIIEGPENNNNAELEDKNKIYDDVIAKIEAEQYEELNKISGTVDTSQSIVEDAATIDQNHYKGHRIRRALVEQSEETKHLLESNENKIEQANIVNNKVIENCEEENAALTIQKHYKGFMARRDVAKKSKEIEDELELMPTQNKIDDATTVVKIENEITQNDEEKNAALVIQKHYKGFKARRDLAKSRELVEDKDVFEPSQEKNEDTSAGTMRDNKLPRVTEEEKIDNPINEQNVETTEKFKDTSDVNKVVLDGVNNCSIKEIISNSTLCNDENKSDNPSIQQFIESIIETNALDVPLQHPAIEELSNTEKFIETSQPIIEYRFKKRDDYKSSVVIEEIIEDNTNVQIDTEINKSIGTQEVKTDTLQDTKDTVDFCDGVNITGRTQLDRLNTVEEDDFVKDAKYILGQKDHENVNSDHKDLSTQEVRVYNESDVEDSGVKTSHNDKKIFDINDLHKEILEAGKIEIGRDDGKVSVVTVQDPQDQDHNKCNEVIQIKENISQTKDIADTKESKKDETNKLSTEKIEDNSKEHVNVEANIISVQNEETKLNKEEVHSIQSNRNNSEQRKVENNKEDKENTDMTSLNRHDKQIEDKQLRDYETEIDINSGNIPDHQKMNKHDDKLEKSGNEIDDRKDSNINENTQPLKSDGNDEFKENHHDFVDNLMKIQSTDDQSKNISNNAEEIAAMAIQKHYKGYKARKGLKNESEVIVISGTQQDDAIQENQNKSVVDLQFDNEDGDKYKLEDVQLSVAKGLEETLNDQKMQNSIDDKNHNIESMKEKMENLKAQDSGTPINITKENTDKTEEANLGSVLQESKMDQTLNSNVDNDTVQNTEANDSTTSIIGNEKHDIVDVQISADIITKLRMSDQNKENESEEIVNDFKSNAIKDFEESNSPIKEVLSDDLNKIESIHNDARQRSKEDIPANAIEAQKDIPSLCSPNEKADMNDLRSSEIVMKPEDENKPNKESVDNSKSIANDNTIVNSQFDENTSQNKKINAHDGHEIHSQFHITKDGDISLNKDSTKHFSAENLDKSINDRKLNNESLKDVVVNPLLNNENNAVKTVSKEKPINEHHILKDVSVTQIASSQKSLKKPLEDNLAKNVTASENILPQDGVTNEIKNDYEKVITNNYEDVNKSADIKNSVQPKDDNIKADNRTNVDCNDYTKENNNNQRKLADTDNNRIDSYKKKTKSSSNELDEDVLTKNSILDEEFMASEVSNSASKQLEQIKSTENGSSDHQIENTISVDHMKDVKINTNPDLNIKRDEVIDLDKNALNATIELGSADHELKNAEIASEELKEQSNNVLTNESEEFERNIEGNKLESTQKVVEEKQTTVNLERSALDKNEINVKESQPCIKIAEIKSTDKSEKEQSTTIIKEDVHCPETGSYSSNSLEEDTATDQDRRINNKKNNSVVGSSKTNKDTANMAKISTTHPSSDSLQSFSTEQQETFAQLKSKSEEIETQLRNSLQEIETFTKEQLQEPFYLHDPKTTSTDTTIQNNPIARVVQIAAGTTHTTTANIELLQIAAANKTNSEAVVKVREASMGQPLFVNVDSLGDIAGPVLGVVNPEDIRDGRLPVTLQLCPDGNADGPPGQVFVIINALDITKPKQRGNRRRASGKMVDSNRNAVAEVTTTTTRGTIGNLEEKSATKIQAGIRGFLVRRRNQKVNNKN